MKEEEGNKRLSDKHEITKYLNQTKLQYKFDSLEIQFLDEEIQTSNSNNNSMMNVIKNIIVLDNQSSKMQKAEEEIKKINEDELHDIMENFILDSENPDIFAMMNVANVGVNLQENQKVEIKAISDNVQKSDDK